MTIGSTRFEPEVVLLRFVGGEPCVEEAGVLWYWSSSKSSSAIVCCTVFIVEAMSEDVITSCVLWHWNVNGIGI
jgi:hypothetical protein